MNNQLQQGAHYRVTANRIGEYVTVGEVYVCDALSRDSVGLHRVRDGAGTYVPRWKIDQGYVTIESV